MPGTVIAPSAFSISTARPARLTGPTKAAIARQAQEFLRALPKHPRNHGMRETPTRNASPPGVPVASSMTTRARTAPPDAVTAELNGLAQRAFLWTSTGARYPRPRCPCAGAVVTEVGTAGHCPSFRAPNLRSPRPVIGTTPVPAPPRCGVRDSCHGQLGRSALGRREILVVLDGDEALLCQPLRFG